LLHHYTPGAPGGPAPAPGDLEQSRAEKEHHARICGGAELPVDRQAQYVTVETAAPVQVGGAQQYPAAQYIHATMLSGPGSQLTGEIGSPRAGQLRQGRSPADARLSATRLSGRRAAMGR
jgi:hypothetical protein